MNIDLRQSVEKYEFDLPKSLIAQFPLATRSDARLMVVERSGEKIEHCHVRDLPELLRPTDCLIQNDSKVVLAKLNGIRRQTGGRWSGLFLEEDDKGLWRLLGKTKGKIQHGELIDLVDRNGQISCQLTLLTKLEGGSWVASCSSGQSAFQTLEQVGSIPLPHYIRGGNMIDDDIENYQTVYASQAGSVAAPTAGLHFTPSLLEQILQRQIRIGHVTLHVGIGTFKPITSDDIDSHQMHYEQGSLSERVAEMINQTRESGGRTIAVGTTSVRVLESAATGDGLSAWAGKTNLFIKPPYEFTAVQGLMTNFHLPRSTLLVLVRTFGGDALIKRAYEVAIREKYRFFSYGDAMLIL